MYSDDQLFIDQAGAILRGDWLGSYNYLTLFKGPFYPLFIAASFLSGIPLLTAQQLLYAAACLVTCLALAPLLRRRGLLLLLLAVLLFNPMSVTNTVATRALREGIYPAITLLSLAGVLGLLLRLDRPFHQRLAWSLLAGASLVAFWLTREERIWILPALAILVCLGAYRTWFEKSSTWQAALTSLVIPAAMLGASVLTICGLNLHYYGVFTITEYDSPVFLKAYGSLTRVKPETWQPLIPVTAETRERIYAVSPAFAQLKPWLEGDIGMMYARYGEAVKSDSHEMGGGWFHIALRQAIDEAGITADGKFPGDFYKRLTREIGTACESGRLDCGPARSSFMAVWNKGYLSPLLKNFGQAFKYMLTFEGYDARLKDCLGTDEQLRPFIDLTRERCWHTQLSVLARGWVVKPGEAISIWVYDDSGKKIVSPTYHTYSPDLAEHFLQMGVDAPEAAIARFQIEADCPSGCSLVVKAGDGSLLEQIAFAESSGSANQPDENGLYYQVEAVEWHSGDEISNPILFKLNTTKARILDTLARVYQKVIPFLAILSFLLFIYQTILVVMKRRTPILWWVEGAFLSAILTRLVMVAWLETSSIDAIITTYLSPNYPLVLVFLSLTYGWVFIHLTRLEKRI